MNGIEQLKRRADKLAEKNGGNVVLLYKADDPLNERIKEELARGNIPLIFDEEDRNL
ncbi:MAG: hypothetical protein PHF57_09690 [Methanoregula sp.]|jgi:hypothetical protein|nr:hypothetical protein [Methanoregula sp.]